ncbi:hypothetical protein NHX12_008661 [Muraenolepis orangiensis]|uniref:Yippee domain-containing protein n=1 Tax=Muraenolepis orangiensis TaxID=630683 RepID=A0A9Q0I896_9TELE|nr:hypothetical protein NHX12_008661 [Muraenolepis orangiensis]
MPYPLEQKEPVPRPLQPQPNPNPNPVMLSLWPPLLLLLLLPRAPTCRCVPPSPPPTTALTCVLRCFPCEPTWAGSPFLHRPPTPPMVRMTRSKTFQAYLPSCHRTYSCIHCRAHLANHDELISKSS